MGIQRWDERAAGAKEEVGGRGKSEDNDASAQTSPAEGSSLEAFPGSPGHRTCASPWKKSGRDRDRQIDG